MAGPAFQGGYVYWFMSSRALRTAVRCHESIETMRFSEVLPRFLTGLALCLLVVSAWAQTPGVFTYQGRLLQNDGIEAPVDGTIDIVFTIWSGPSGDSGATALWSEQWNGVSLSNGVFNVLLGSNGSPLDPADFQGDQTLFLELEINGETLSPRQQMGSVPFAMVDEPGNELQDLSRTGDTLQLTESPATVDLSDYLDNTDNQALSLSGSQLELTSEDGVDIVDLAFLDNPPQDLAIELPSNTLSLSDDPTPVDLSPYLDNTDNQSLIIVGNELRLTSDDGEDVIDLSPYLDNTDGQTLSLSGVDLTISGSGSMVDLGPFLDNTDNQVLSISGSQLRLTSDDGDDIVDLSGLGSDSQTLTLSGTSLSISGSGSTVDLAAFLDNTDQQSLALSGNTLSISGSASTINLAPYLDNTDNQTLGLSGNTLSISGSGSTVSLAAYLDNTDNQNLDDVLAQGGNANFRNISNVNSLDVTSLTVEGNFLCDADTANCIRTENIEQDTIGGNDIQDNIYIVWIDCNGSCADMSMRNACDSIEELRGLSHEAELIGVSCVHDVPSTSGNGFVPCPVQNGTDNECRAFNLRTLGDIPCIDGTGTDAIVTCLATDIPR